jgi:hypothetical protein
MEGVVDWLIGWRYLSAPALRSRSGTCLATHLEHPNFAL